MALDLGPIQELKPPQLKEFSFEAKEVLKKEGYKIAYYPEVFIYHRRRPNIQGLMKQFFNYGLTRVKKERALGNKINLLYLLPSLFIIYLICIAKNKGYLTCTYFT